MSAGATTSVREMDLAVADAKPTHWRPEVRRDEPLRAEELRVEALRVIEVARQDRNVVDPRRRHVALYFGSREDARPRFHGPPSSADLGGTALKGEPMGTSIVHTFSAIR